ncbi:MAG TPA: AMP-binding protein [Ktedonobacteraceae bacterium]|jgi:acyl-CoA synthetase (AMP-forming)/AMP-acid ligase II
MNLYNYLLANAREEKLAILSRKEHVTYAELVAYAESIALALQRLGVREEERVGILAENSAFWVASYLAILKIGAIATPLPSRLHSGQCQSLLELVQCSAFCADPARMTKWAALLPAHSKIVTPQRERMRAYAATVEISRPENTWPGPATTPARLPDLAALMFTSGSTGQPNAVKISHQNIRANTESIIAYLGLKADERMLVVLPFDYCFGASLLHTHLRMGATLVINTTFLYPDSVIKDLASYQCTGFAGVPATYQHLLRTSSFLQHTFPHLRHVQQAGGKLADVCIRAFLAQVPHVQFFVMYGQTEATARLAYLQPERLAEKTGSIGRAIPGVSLQVLDRAGQAVRPGEEGEIVAAGENIASGYCIPDPTKENFRGGKLYTGDLATVDEEGFIYVTGRSGDFIKPYGHRISCKEIEEVLMEIPEIVEVAVVGRWSSEQGEIPKAYIVAAENQKLSTERIVGYCKNKLPRYALPREIEFLSDLPKNAAHKILKHRLV